MNEPVGIKLTAWLYLPIGISSPRRIMCAQRWRKYYYPYFPNVEGLEQGLLHNLLNLVWKENVGLLVQEILQISRQTPRSIKPRAGSLCNWTGHMSMEPDKFRQSWTATACLNHDLKTEVWLQPALCSYIQGHQLLHFLEYPPYPLDVPGLGQT